MPIITQVLPGPKTIFSSQPFQDPQGNVLSLGFLVLDLSSMAVVTGQGGQVVPLRISIPLDANGLIPANTLLWANDQLSPSNTFYQARIYNANNLFVGGPLIWIVSGASPIDVSLLSNLTPVSTNPNAVLQNPTGSQTIVGFPLSITSNLNINRLFINQGTPLQPSDFTISAGWGAGATVTVVGTDAACEITMTAGTSPTVAPTVTLNYHDGVWNLRPMVFAIMTNGTGIVSDLTVSSNTAQALVTYDGLPVATKTYLFFLMSLGRP